MHNFSYMPLAARVGTRVLCMHGGVSPLLESWQDIIDIKRPIENLAGNSLACHLTWSDPDREALEFEVSHCLV